MPRKTLKRLALYTSRLAVSGKGSQSKQKGKVPGDRRRAPQGRLLFHSEGGLAPRSDPASFHEAALRILTNLGEQRGDQNKLRNEDLRSKAASAAFTFASQPVWNRENSCNLDEGSCSRTVSQCLEENPLWRYAAMDRADLGAAQNAGAVPEADKEAMAWFGHLQDKPRECQDPEADNSTPMRGGGGQDQMREGRPQVDKEAMTWYSSLQQQCTGTPRRDANGSISQRQIHAAMSAFASLNSRK